MAVLKQKMPIFWKRSPTKKNVTAQKSLRICFYPYIDGQKKFFIFFGKKFFWNTLLKKNFSLPKFFWNTNPFITLGYPCIWPQKWPPEASSTRCLRNAPPRTNPVISEPVQCRVNESQHLTNFVSQEKLDLEILCKR